MWGRGSMHTCGVHMLTTCTGRAAEDESGPDPPLPSSEIGSLTEPGAKGQPVPVTLLSLHPLTQSTGVPRTSATTAGLYVGSGDVTLALMFTEQALLPSFHRPLVGFLT